MPKKPVYKESEKTFNRRVAKVAKKVIFEQSDTKHKFTNTSLAVTSASIQDEVARMSQGSQDSQRVGDQCRLESVRFRMRYGPLGSSTPTTVRTIIYRWKELDSATLPSGQEVCQQAFGTDYTSVMTGLENATIPSRAIILKDFLVSVCTGAGTLPVHRDFTINLRNIEQTYTGDYSTNNIYVLCIGQDDTASSAVYYSADLKFKDI